MQPDFHQMAQEIFTLSSLTDNLPIVKTPDGGEFVPLRALCEMVGLRPSAYVGVFCQYFEVGVVRRLLSWDSPTGHRKDWCLNRKHLPHWLVNVPASRVPPERREKVLTLQNYCTVLLGRTYEMMIERHREARRTVFELLNACAREEEKLQRYEQDGASLFNQAQQQALAKKAAEGHQLLERVANLARRMLSTLMAGPVVDGVVLNKNNEVTDTTSFPLFPIVGDTDQMALEMAELVKEWAAHFKQWWDKQLELWADS